MDGQLHAHLYPRCWCSETILRHKGLQVHIATLPELLNLMVLNGKCPFHCNMVSQCLELSALFVFPSIKTGSLGQCPLHLLITYADADIWRLGHVGIRLPKGEKRTSSVQVMLPTSGPWSV
jgi:hypothetical protein